MQGQIQEEEGMEMAVHEIRRTIKRFRAILRLIRDEIGYAAFYRENRFYRELSARLSPMRDEAVLRQTILKSGDGQREFLRAKEKTRLQEVFRERIERSVKSSRFDTVALNSWWRILKRAGRGSPPAAGSGRIRIFSGPD